MTQRWRHAYRLESPATGFAMAIAGLIVLGVSALRTRAAPTLETLGFFVLWETLLLRTLLVGLYIGDTGVKVRTMWRSRMVPWPRVARAWAGPATGYDATAIWISVTTGADVETPIWRRSHGVGHTTRVSLDDDAFASLLADLNARARDARPDDSAALGR